MLLEKHDFYSYDQNEAYGTIQIYQMKDRKAEAQPYDFYPTLSTNPYLNQISTQTNLNQKAHI